LRHSLKIRPAEKRFKIIWQMLFGSATAVARHQIDTVYFYALLTGFQNLSGVKLLRYMQKTETLQYGQYYHIYNCGINGEVLFCEETNY
jgi:hypothetical protein